MSLVLDLLLVVMIFACAYRARSRTVYRTVANLLVLVAVFAGASLLSLVFRPVVQSLFVEPPYARTVAKDMADMVSASVLNDPYKTVESIDVPALIEKQPDQFAQLTGRYNVTPQTVLEAVQTAPENDMTPSEAALKSIVKPAANDVSKGIAFAALFLILWLIFGAIAKKIYEKRALGVKITRNPAVSLCLGILIGILWCYTLVATLIKCGYPYDFGLFSLLNLRSGVDNSFLTKYLVLFNPF